MISLSKDAPRKSFNKCTLLPPASESMTEGNVFTLSNISGGRGGGGVPHLRSGWGGDPIPGVDWGYHIPDLDGVPHPADEGGGDSPSQVWMGGGSTPSC